MKSTRPIDLCAETDAELIQLSRQGDQHAYGRVVERYQSLVCSVAYNRCGDLAFSEDLAQDAFILAWQKLVDLEDINKFKPWICTIVRNLAHRSSQRSSRSVTRTAAHLDSVGDIPSDIETPIQRAVSAEEEQLAWQALADLPENYREPLILFHREEQSVARVAEALDLSEDAVKQRLSRGRKMLQQHLAAVVESTLANSKPTKAFTGAVLLGLSGVSAKTATAATVTTASASAAKSAAGVGAGSGLGFLFLLKLPVLAWLVKEELDDARSRSDREQKVRRRSYLIITSGFVCYLIAMGGYLFYLPALLSLHWWEEYIKPSLLLSVLFGPAGMMVVFIVPLVIYCRQLSKQCERIRIEEGTFTPPRPLVESDHNGPIASKVYRFFCLSSLFVVAGPAVLPFVARDWLALSAMLASAICISLTAAQMSLRFPNRSYLLFRMGTGLTAFAMLGTIYWKMSVWESAFDDIFPWFVGATSALTTTMVIVIMIGYKRVYGKTEPPGESSEKSSGQE